MASIRIKENKQMVDMSTENRLKIEGIVTTEALIAFSAYSRHDLESMIPIVIDC